MPKLSRIFQENNLLAWLTANGSVWLAAYTADKPFALSWEQLKEVEPKLAANLKRSGIGRNRLPESWGQNLSSLDARGAAVYAQNIPKPILRLGPNAIKNFKQGKHWSHQISYKQGLEQGMSRAELADASNGIFETAADNLRRGSLNMSEGWGSDKHPGKLQIQFFNELEALKMVCEQIAVNAAKGFMIGYVYELTLSALEQGLAYSRQEISLNQAVKVILTQATRMGLKGAAAAAMITGICAYIPGAGIILTTISPILVAMASIITLKRVHDVLTIHLKKTGTALPVDFPLTIYKSAQEGINQGKEHLRKYPWDFWGSACASSQTSIAEYKSLQNELDELLE